MPARPPIDIRSARGDEIETVGRLYWSVWHETHAPLQPAAVAAYRDAGFFLARMRALPQPPLVAIGDGVIIGFGGWSGRILGQLFVAGEERGNGVGARLLAACEQAIADSGHGRASLFVVKGNDFARAFYIRHGWQDVSARVSDAATHDGPPSRRWRGKHRAGIAALRCFKIRHGKRSSVSRSGA